MLLDRDNGRCQRFPTRQACTEALSHAVLSPGSNRFRRIRHSIPVGNRIQVSRQISRFFSYHRCSLPTHSSHMPYTALQTLGYLARCSNWERIYNINRTPYRKGKTTNCRLLAYRARYRKSGRKVVVLKRTGPRKMACGCGGCHLCGRFIGECFADCNNGLTQSD